MYMIQRFPDMYSSTDIYEIFLAISVFFRCPYKKAYNRKNIKNYKRKRIYKNFYAVKCILQYSVYMCEFLKFFTLPGIALFVFPLRIYTKTNKIH